MPKSTSSAAESLRIAIVRVSAIGDVLHASPVAAALKAQYPQAHIAWIVQPLSAPLVRANPYVDEVILADIDAWERMWKAKQFGALWRSVRTFLRDMRARQFDVAIDCQGLLKSGLLSWSTHAPRRIGPTPPREGNQLFATESARWPERPTRLAEKYLAMLTPLGIPVTPRRLVLEVPQEDVDGASQFLADHGLQDAPYAACCVSSTRPQKDWVWERWGELADQLWEQLGWRTIFIGGPERREDAARLVEKTASHAVSAVGTTSLLQSANLVQRARVVIGVDTGLTYAGLTADVPTVALYGSTDAAWLTEEPHTAICLHPMPCAPCRRRPTCMEYDCMRAIIVEEVVNAVRRVTTGLRRKDES